MRLKQWLSEHDVSAERFGRDIGVSGQAVRRYASGSRMPDAATVERIARATRGMVGILDLHRTRLDHLRDEGKS